MTDKFNQLTGKLGPLTQALMLGAISAQVSARFPAVEYAIEKNILWGKRRVIYTSRYPEKPADYNDALKIYQKTFTEIDQATLEGFSPDKAARFEQLQNLLRIENDQAREAAILSWYDSLSLDEQGQVSDEISITLNQVVEVLQPTIDYLGRAGAEVVWAIRDWLDSNPEVKAYLIEMEKDSIP